MTLEERILEDMDNGYTLKEIKNKIKSGNYHKINLGLILFVGVSLFLLCFLISLDLNVSLFSYLKTLKTEITTRNTLLVQSREANQLEKLRIDKLFQISYNLAKDFPAVGRGMQEIFVDIQQDRLDNIDQRIADLPDAMQSVYAAESAANYGLDRYSIFDKDYAWPLTLKDSFVPSQWGEFVWRPSWFTDDKVAYVDYQEDKASVWTIHGGMDLANPYDPRVFASNEGKVIEVGDSALYGKYIIIEHIIKNKPYATTYYGHLIEFFVCKGQYVHKRDLIGLIGESGKRCFGKHLHFEYREKIGDRLVNKNFVLNSVHKKKWIYAFYWKQVDVISKDNTIKKIWKVVIL